MKKREYIQPHIKTVTHLPYVMLTLSVINGDDPIDDEDDILSADDPLNPRWGEIGY